MYSRFDTEARIAVAQATDIARELGHREVGPDHLLLGLLANMRGTAYAALTDHGLRLDTARDVVATRHVDTDDETHDDTGEPAGEPDGLAEDREALRAIGIDLDRVREAVRENLGAELTDDWGSRSQRGRRGSRGRGRGESRRGRGHGGHPHGRGRRGPRSRRLDGPSFSAGLRDVLHEVRRGTFRDRDRQTGGRDRGAGMTGPQLALALTGCDDPVVQAVLTTATDLDGLRSRLQSAVAPSPSA